MQHALSCRRGSSFAGGKRGRFANALSWAFFLLENLAKAVQPRAHVGAPRRRARRSQPPLQAEEVLDLVAVVVGRALVEVGARARARARVGAELGLGPG